MSILISLISKDPISEDNSKLRCASTWLSFLLGERKSNIKATVSVRIRFRMLVFLFICALRSVHMATCLLGYLFITVMVKVGLGNGNIKILIC